MTGNPEAEAKAAAKKEEQDRIAAEKAAKEKDESSPPKRGRGRPPGTSKKDDKGDAAPKPKRKPPEQVTDTYKALKQSFKDQKKLVTAHKKKFPTAKVGAVDPFTVEREPLKMEEAEAVGLAHLTVDTLGNALRVPSLIPGEEKVDELGKKWSRALPYMNIDAGRAYIVIAAVSTAGIVLPMVVMSILRLMGKFQDPLIDNVESQLAPQLMGLDEDGLDVAEGQLRAQLQAELDAVAQQRERLKATKLQSVPGGKKDESN